MRHRFACRARSRGRRLGRLWRPWRQRAQSVQGVGDPWCDRGGRWSTELIGRAPTDSRVDGASWGSSTETTPRRAGPGRGPPWVTWPGRGPCQPCSRPIEPAVPASCPDALAPVDLLVDPAVTVLVACSAPLRHLLRARAQANGYVCRYWRGSAVVAIVPPWRGMGGVFHGKHSGPSAPRADTTAPLSTVLLSAEATWIYDAACNPARPRVAGRCDEGWLPRGLAGSTGSVDDVLGGTQGPRRPGSPRYCPGPRDTPSEDHTGRRSCPGGARPLSPHQGSATPRARRTAHTRHRAQPKPTAPPWTRGPGAWGQAPGGRPLGCPPRSTRRSTAQPAGATVVFRTGRTTSIWPIGPAAHRNVHPSRARRAGPTPWA